MRKVLIVLAMVAGMIFTTAPAEAHSHVRPRVCASKWVYNHLHSATARQCKRQGFYYEKGSYEVDGQVLSYVLVYGPNGRLWVDTAGFYTVPNVR